MQFIGTQALNFGLMSSTLVGQWGLAAKQRHLEILPALSQSGGAGSFAHAETSCSQLHKAPEGATGRGDSCVLAALVRTGTLILHDAVSQ